MVSVPIPKVRDVDRAFPTSDAFPEMWMPTLDDIPYEFELKRKWQKFFHRAFFTADLVKWERVGMLPREGVDPNDAWRAMEVVMGLRDIKHEHKEALWPYLGSQWFEDVRFELTSGEMVTFEDSTFDLEWRAAQGEG